MSSNASTPSARAGDWLSEAAAASMLRPAKLAGELLAGGRAGL
jgi:hypothetical protein